MQDISTSETSLEQQMPLELHQSREVSMCEQSARAPEIDADCTLEARSFSWLSCTSLKAPRCHLAECSQQKETAVIEAAVCWHHDLLSLTWAPSPARHFVCSSKEWHAAANKVTGLTCKCILWIAIAFQVQRVSSVLRQGCNSNMLCGVAQVLEMCCQFQKHCSSKHVHSYIVCADLTYVQMTSLLVIMECHGNPFEG